MCVSVSYDGNDSFDHIERDQIKQSEKGTVCVLKREYCCL